MPHRERSGPYGNRHGFSDPSWGLLKSWFAQVVVGLLLGIGLGVFTPDFGTGLKFFSDAFLKLITMIAAPSAAIAGRQ